MQRINSQIMKSYNTLSVIKTVQRNAPISRSELVKRIGLTSASVINITNGLLRRGILVESGFAQETGQGRKALMLDIRSDAAYVVGVHLTTEDLVVAVSDLRGARSGVLRQPISGSSSARQILDQIVEGVNGSIACAQIDRQKIVGVGLSLPGPLDVSSGIFVNPPNFPDLVDVPVRDILEQRLGLSVCCDRETNCAVLAEYEIGCAAGYKTAFFISLFRAGVGGGIITNGNVLHGFCDSAGEIGHTTVDITGPRCSCGNFGCLEALVSEQALVQRALKLSRLHTGAASGNSAAEVRTLEDIFRMSSAGDDVCAYVVREAAAHISLALGNAISLYSPEIIILGGTLPQLCPEVVDLVREKIHGRPYPRQCSKILVVGFSLHDMVFVAGAAMHAWERFLPKLLPGESEADSDGSKAQ